MTTFTVHTTQSAPADSRPILDEIARSFGYVPNLFGVFAESPAALRGAIVIFDAFSHSTLSPLEQQLVMLAVSEANDCAYCVAAHSSVARQIVKIDPSLIDAVRRRVSLPDAKLDALVTFTRTVVEQRGIVADAEVGQFLGAGYSRAQVLDVLLGVGMKTFHNYVDHIAHTPLNDQFKRDAWQPKRRVA